MNNFFTRTITGAVFTIVIVGCLLNFYTALGCFFVVIVVGSLEFYKLVRNTEHTPYIITGIILACVTFIAIVLSQYKVMEVKVSTILIPVYILFLISILFQKKNHILANTSLTLFAILYFTLPFVLFLILPSLLYNRYEHRILLGIFILLWSYDTFAYLTGILIGKHKLMNVSPKKTWEGLLGGILLSLASACILSLCFTILTLLQWLILSLIISLFGTTGDLLASLFKRNVNIKDSGKLLPGHGGIIDRFDSFILAAPAAFVFLQIIKQQL